MMIHVAQRARLLHKRDIARVSRISEWSTFLGQVLASVLFIFVSVDARAMMLPNLD